jgi:regulatory protein
MSAKAIRASCLRLLARREYSQLELLTQLTLKGFIKKEVQAVIDTLACEGLQSDQRFAENYAQSRFYKGFGYLKIKNELTQRGIKNVDLQAIMLENIGDEISLIRQVYHKKYATNKPVTTLKETLKRQRFLQQRGFSISVIQKLFKQLERTLL